MKTWKRILRTISMKRKSACLAKDYGKKRWTNHAIDIANLISEKQKWFGFYEHMHLVNTKGSRIIIDKVHAYKLPPTLSLNFY